MTAARRPDVAGSAGRTTAGGTVWVAPEQPYPARLDIDYPLKLDRFASFFRLIAIVPIAIVSSVLSASTNETVTTITGDSVVSTTTRSGGGIAGGCSRPRC